MLELSSVQGLTSMCYDKTKVILCDTQLLTKQRRSCKL